MKRVLKKGGELTLPDSKELFQVGDFQPIWLADWGAETRNWLDNQFYDWYLINQGEVVFKDSARGLWKVSNYLRVRIDGLYTYPIVEGIPNWRYHF